MQTKKTVVVAMSGGVDSSVAAILLHNQGFRVIGITMKLWDFEQVGGNINNESGCCSLESFDDARMICNSIDIPHYILNFSKEFQKEVINNFTNEYLAGRTPNPCIQCNTKIKWQTLLKKSGELGADFIATGHYANIQFNKSTGRYELFRAIEEGLVELDAPITTYLPEFNIQSTYTAHDTITIRDILAHRAGLPRHEGLLPPGVVRENLNYVERFELDACVGEGACRFEVVPLALD